MQRETLVRQGHTAASRPLLLSKKQTCQTFIQVFCLPGSGVSANHELSFTGKKQRLNSIYPRLPCQSSVLAILEFFFLLTNLCIAVLINHPQHTINYLADLEVLFSFSRISTFQIWPMSSTHGPIASSQTVLCKFPPADVGRREAKFSGITPDPGFPSSKRLS